MVEVMCQALSPANYRYCMKPDGYHPAGADLERQHIAHTQRECGDFVYGASYPAVSLHDRHRGPHLGDKWRNPRPERR